MKERLTGREREGKKYEGDVRKKKERKRYIKKKSYII